MDELNTLLAINEAFNETLQNLIRRVTLAISKNREAQVNFFKSLKILTFYDSFCAFGNLFAEIVES